MERHFKVLRTAGRFIDQRLKGQGKILSVRITNKEVTVEHRLYVFQGTVPKKRLTEKNVQPKISYNTLI